MQLLSTIIYVNSDISTIAENNLVTQLNITEVMNDTEFNARLIVDPNYPVFVHLNNLRIIVKQDFQDQTNRQFADIVLFVKQGMVNVLQNNYGPPTLSMPIERLNLFNLLANNNRILTCLSCHCGCQCNCFKHLPLPIQRMLINPFDISGIHNANCDNQYNNTDWLNRN